MRYESIDAIKGSGLPETDRADIVEMSRDVAEMLGQVRRAFERLVAGPLDEAGRVGRRVHQEEHAILDRIASRASRAASGEPASEDAFIALHLESIADNTELLAASTSKLVRDGILFTDRATREMRGLFQTAHELLEALRDALRTGNRILVRYVLDAGRTCEERANEYALVHEKRLIEGVCLPTSSSAYLAMLDAFRGIEWHARQIAEKL